MVTKCEEFIFPYRLHASIYGTACKYETVYNTKHTRFSQFSFREITEHISQVCKHIYFSYLTSLFLGLDLSEMFTVSRTIIMLTDLNMIFLFLQFSAFDK